MSGAITVGVIGVAAGAYGASQQAGAAKDAAGMQEDAANLARADQLALMRQQRQDSEPYRESGYNALAQLNYLMGLGSPTTTAKTRDYFDAEKYKQWRIQKMTEAVNKLYPNNPDKAARIIARKTEKIGANLSDEGVAWADYKKRSTATPAKTSGEFWKTRDAGTAAGSGEDFGFLQQRFNSALFEKDPGYQFRMDEGNKAVQGSAAAQGGLLSGAAMKAMQRYSQGFASNEYGNAYNRFTGDQQNMYNRLAQMAGSGQQQVNQTAQMNQSGMDAANQYRLGAAQAGASGIMGAANARSSGYSAIGNSMMNAYGALQNRDSGFAAGEPNGSDWGSRGYSDGMVYDTSGRR